MTIDSLTVILFLLFTFGMYKLLTRRNTCPDGTDDSGVRRDHLMQ